MNELALVGKQKTIRYSISVLLISMHTIYFYHALRNEFDSNKFITQLIRFFLTALFLYYTYKGKKWAVNTLIVLFLLGIILATIAIFTIKTPLVNKIPLLVMLFIYANMIYLLKFSKHFKAFYKYRNS